VVIAMNRREREKLREQLQASSEELRADIAARQCEIDVADAPASCVQQTPTAKEGVKIDTAPEPEIVRKELPAPASQAPGRTAAALSF
jgi:hypothetical protein